MKSHMRSASTQHSTVCMCAFTSHGTGANTRCASRARSTICTFQNVRLYVTSGRSSTKKR